MTELWHVHDVIAFDIATVTGWARGRVGGVPSSGTVSFGAKGASHNAIFGNALRTFARMLEGEPRPEILVMEALLPAEAVSNAETRNLLAGLQGICRGVAHMRKIYNIGVVNVGDVRQHFINYRNAPRDRAKRDTITRCKQLGWAVADDNAADALACWHFACSLIKPELALETSPLFNRRLAG